MKKTHSLIVHAFHPAAPDLGCDLGPSSTARRRRVAYLGFAILAMSVADLYLTMLFATGVGLAEANPVARALMTNTGAWALPVWKLLTVLPFMLVLLRFGRRASTEAAAWLVCLTLTVVTMRWRLYAGQVDDLTLALPYLQQGIDVRWISITR